MEKMNVFIGQPMRGRTDEEIGEERRKVMEYVAKLYPDRQVTEINSLFDTDVESHNVPLRMLGMSIELLAEADIAVFTEGWVAARGCKIEYDCAGKYGIRILDLD